jgi:6-phosphogluconolactonase
MTEPTIHVVKDVAQAGAEYVVAGLRAALEESDTASLVLAGGNTPLALYARLAEADLPWERVHVFWGDERLVPPDDPASNYAAAAEALLRHLTLPEANVHRIKGELEPVAAVADYAEQLRDFAQRHDPGCPSPWPRFDVALLGLGEDGHTASLFPGSPAVCVVPVQAVEAEYDGRPAQRITLTPIVFNHARRVAFVVTGQNKAAAVAAALGPERDPDHYPAQRIEPEEGEVVWFLDKAAARAIGEG